MRIVYLFSLILVSILSISNRSGPALVHDRGTTGAPGEPFGQVCASCHTSNVYGVTTTTLIITDQSSGSAITSYIPGVDYDYQLTVSNTVGTPAGYGFQITAYEAGETADAFSSVSGNSKIVPVSNNTGPDRNYVEHNGFSGSPVFTGVWTAPASGTGDVIFYRVGNCVNNNFGQSGDTGGNSQITTITEDTTVPVEISSFKVIKSGSNVQITWTTATETNNDYYIVEHSNGNKFIPLTKVKASGFSDSYEFMHMDVNYGVHYYKIKQVDYDGRSSVTKEIRIKLEQPDIKIYPNPISDFLEINIPDDVHVKRIKILNSIGSIMIESLDTSIDMSHLTKGMYFVQFELVSGKKISKKALKI
jgi:hypothetical protein